MQAMHHHSGLNSHDVARQDSKELSKCVCSTTQDTSDWIEGEIDLREGTIIEQNPCVGKKR